MTAAETIAAAIQKLEAAVRYPVPASVERAALAWARNSQDESAQTILRLTSPEVIDAQLTILRDANKALTNPVYMADYGEFVESTFRHPLLIARAILGEASCLP